MTTLAVIGLGVISRFYLAAIERLPHVRLGAVCDLDDDVLEPLRGRVPCYRDHRELLARGGVDAVIVTVPNDAHAAVCRDVLAAGLPVCVEKPIATRLADAYELADLAAARGVRLFTAFHRRYNAQVRALASRLPADVPVTSLTVRYLERIEEHVGRDRWYLDPSRCGGCVADNGPNAFDLVRLLLPDPRVTSADMASDAAGVDRRATVELTAADGARARVELDWSYDGEAKDLTVRLADGSEHHADMLAGYPGFKQSLWHEYLGVIEDFTRPSARPDGGVPALELVDAAYHAARVTA